MPKRIYNGPCPAVDVVLPDGVVTVERGKSINVPAAIAVSLDEQGDWNEPAAKTGKSTNKAASGEESESS